MGPFRHVLVLTDAPCPAVAYAVARGLWEKSHRLLPPEVADGARAVVRGCMLARWNARGRQGTGPDGEPADGQLVVSVRGDGDGALLPEAPAEYRLRQRLAGLGSDFSVEAVPRLGHLPDRPVSPGAAPAPTPKALDGLSGRELAVLTDLARGRSSRELITRLRITEHTVKTHVANILVKLGVRSRGKAAAAARTAHL